MSDETPLDRRAFAGSVVIAFFVLLIVGLLVSSCVTHVTGKLDPNPVYNFQREQNQTITLMATVIGLITFGIALLFVIGGLKDEWRRHEAEIEAEQKKREAAAYWAKQREIDRQRHEAICIAEERERTRYLEQRTAELRKQVAEQEARARDAEAKLRTVR